MKNLLVKIKEKKFDELLVLKDLEIEFLSGNLTMIAGPSGCGKSTMLNIIVNKDSDYKGTVTDVTKVYVEQKVLLIEEFTVRENISISYKLNDDKVIKYANILKIDKFLDVKVKNLSGGERQRVSILRALVGEFNYIILDEPTSNLDIENAKELMKCLVEITQTGVGIIMTSHNLELFDYANVVYEYQDNLFINVKNNSNFIGGSTVLNSNVLNDIYMQMKLYRSRYIFKDYIYVLMMTLVISLIVSFGIYMNGFLNSDWKIDHQTMSSEYTSVKKMGAECAECSMEEISFSEEEINQIKQEFTVLGEYGYSYKMKVDLSGNQIESIPFAKDLELETENELVDIRKEVASRSTSLSQVNELSGDLFYSFSSVPVDQYYISLYGSRSIGYEMLGNIMYGTTNLEDENDAIIPYHLALEYSLENNIPIDEVIGKQIDIETTSGIVTYDVVGVYDESYASTPKEIQAIYVKGTNDLTSEYLYNILVSKYAQSPKFTTLYPTYESFSTVNETGVVEIIVSGDSDVEALSAYGDVYNKRIDFKQNYVKEQLFNDVLKLIIFISIIFAIRFSHRFIKNLFIERKKNDYNVFVANGFTNIQVGEFFSKYYQRLFNLAICLIVVIEICFISVTLL
jgi:putative ABC transport system ATP-binding protein